ncbi:helix-turn-helix domain-containing protein [Nocardiopsis nanhaiensis]
MGRKAPDPAWSAFGQAMKEHRGNASPKLRQAEAARKVGVAASHYSNWENGVRRPEERYVLRIDEVLNANGNIVAEWEKASRQAHAPMRFVELPVLEETALEIREYQPLLIPGLVQTEAYAHAMFEDIFPGMGQHRIDHMVQARMTRQKVLEKDPRPLIILIITEAVLHQEVGGRGKALLRDQWRRLLADAETGKVRVQIIPRETGRHYGSGGPFRLYTFSGKPPVASAEYMTGETVISDADRYRECATSFGLLQGEALPEAVSLRMLHGMVDDDE